MDSMAAVQREQGEFTNANIILRHVVEQGESVAVHTQILFSKTDPGKGGLRQVHIFRFGGGDKIIENRDVTQVTLPDMPHAGNAF